MYSDDALKMIINALRKRGYKATPQRIAICKAAIQDLSHPTAQEIYKKVKRDYPTISLATVYQTLKVLREINLVQELPFFQRKIRFDAHTKPHINLVCLKCGAIEDLQDPTLYAIIDKASGLAGFKVIGQRIDVYGICKRCSKQ